MNNQSTSDDSSQYASVLATLTHENENCHDDPLHPHSLDTEAFETELVHMDDLTIVTSNGQGRLTSRILSENLGPISNSKPDDLLQQNCQMDEHSLIFKSSPFSNSKHTKWKERSLIKKGNSLIYPKTDDSNTCNTSDFSNNEIDNIILSVNKLPQQSTNNTAVEQPNIGPCSCFICGQVLVDPGERFTYLKSQKLFSMKISLLELLSNMVNQTVITDTEAIDLCQRCSELMNEADITCKHLYDLREKINKLFTINKRPKLTFHILPKPPSVQVATKNYVLKNSSYVSLSDLACSRPRRGRSKKASANGTKKIDLENEKREKKKGGRPRKPFQCHICRRKFVTQSLVNKHLFKEHNISVCNTTDTPSESITSSSALNIPDNINLIVKVKEEKTDEDKESEIKPSQSIFSSDQELSHCAIEKSLLIENLELGGIQPAVRPIQPKPQTVVQTAVDGSLIYLMSPTTGEAAPSIIKISPGYLNLKTGNHTCELCQKTFSDDKGYKMHKIAAHGIRKKKSDSECGVNESVTLNEDNKEGFQKLWHCDVCNNVFLSKKLLSDHKRQSHENIFKGITLKETKKVKLYSCTDCDQLFNYKYELEKHRESHLPFHKVGPHEFLCCICGLKVASKAALKIHLHRFHTKDVETKDFLCAECGYMTGTKKSFTDHLRVHNDSPGQKKVCHLCKKEMLPSSFKIHMIRMHGEAKYPCEICGQRFTLRSVLMKHLNTIHSSLRPYDCILCSQKFVTAEALRYHKNKIHSTVFHFCDVCGKNFKWKGELRTHMNRMHTDSRARHQCSTCARSYADRRKLHQHMINKHNMAKGSALIKKQENEVVIKTSDEVSSSYSHVEVNSKHSDMVSSSYNVTDTLLSSPSIVTTSIPCTSSYNGVATSVPCTSAYSGVASSPLSCPSTYTGVVATPVCSSSFTSVHLLTEDDDNLTSTLNAYSDDQDSLRTLHGHAPLHHDLNDEHTQVTTLTHYENTSIHVTSHEALEHQSLSSGLITQSKMEHSQHQNVQSIYLVSNLPISTPHKSS